MASVWVIRGGPDNRLVDEFIDGGVIGVGYGSVPDATQLDRHEIDELLREEGKSARVEMHSAMLVAFVQRIALGDVVIMPDTPRGDVVIGEITGAYKFHPGVPEDHYRHRRSVRWLGRLRHADLPPGRQELYRQRQTLREVHRADDLVDYAKRAGEGQIGRPATER